MRLLEDLLKELEAFGIKSELIISGSPQLGSDLAMPCFKIAQASPENPQTMAESIASKIKHSAVDRVQAVGGYVNLWLEPGFLAQRVHDLTLRERPLGFQPPLDQTVIVEFFSPNLAKPLSAGHLRNLFQGWALTNLYRARGYTVVTDNHLGDWGKVFGMWVVGYLRYGKAKDIKELTLEEMGEMYKKIVQDLKAEAGHQTTPLEDEVQNWLLKLQNGQPEAWRYHRAFVAVSMQVINDLLLDLGINFDEQLGESFYHQKQNSFKLLGDLKERGLVRSQADGSIIARLEKESIDTPLLLLKSNGGTLYATADVATLAYRQERWQPRKIVYVVGAEQQFYFKQLFAFNNQAQLTSADLVHHAYGLVEELNDQGRRVKMSSRRGAIGLEEILRKAYKMAKVNSQKALSEQDLQIIAQGGLIFQEFRQNKQHNVLFDWQKMFSLQDMTGSYVQYATLRIKSILNKAPEQEYTPAAGYDWQAEHLLLRRLISFEDVMHESIMYSELHKIALHLFEFSQELNRYYEQTAILTSNQPARSSRLWLMKVIYDHLLSALGILGIKIPSQM